MNLRPLAILTVVAVIAMLAISAWAWGQLPDNAQIPIHFGLNGQPDGYGPKWLGFLLMPAITGVLGVVFLVIPRFDPRGDHLRSSNTAWIAMTGSVILLLFVVHVAVVLVALGNSLDIGRLLGISAGGMLVVIGNFLGKTRSNWFMGVRTPWTLSSERSWTKTHRLAGRLFVVVGISSIILALVSTAELVFVTLIPGLIGTTLIVVVYSYFAWRDDPDRRPI